MWLGCELQTFYCHDFCFKLVVFSEMLTEPGFLSLEECVSVQQKTQDAFSS